MARLTKGLLAVTAVLLCLGAIIYPSLRKIIPMYVSHLTGLKVTLKDLKLFQGQFEGLQIKDTDLTFGSSIIKIQNPIIQTLQGRFNEIALYEPYAKLTSLSTKRQSDLNIFRKLPHVNRLTIERGSLNLSDRDSNLEISARSIHMQLTDYSPSKGGSMVIRFLFSIKDKRDEAIISEGSLSAVSRIVPLKDNLFLDGRFEASIDTIQIKSLKHSPIIASGAFRYSEDGLFVTDLNLSLKEFALKVSNKDISLKDLSCLSDLQFLPNTKELVLSKIKGSVVPLGTFDANLRLSIKEHLSYNSTVSLKTLDVKRVLNLLKPLLSEQINELEASGSATLSADMKGTIHEGNFTLIGDLSVDFRDISLSSTDGLKAAQGVTGTMQIQLNYPKLKDNKKGASVELHIDTNITSGEYLYNSLYFSQTKDLKLRSWVAVSADIKDTYELVLDSDLFSTGRYRVFVEGKEDDWKIHASLSDIDLYRLYQNLIKDTIFSKYPSTEGLNVSGLVNLLSDIQLSKSGYSAIGELDLKELSFWLPKVQAGVSKMRASIPFFIDPADRAVQTKSTKGLISFEKIRLREMELQQFKFPIDSYPNKLKASGVMTLDFLDGQLIIDALEIALAAGEPLIKTSFRLADATISPITESLGFGAFSGKLKAQIADLKIDTKVLTTDGFIDIDIFGGKVFITNIYAELPFNFIAADIDFSGIDLEKLTETIKIGRITGIIKGSIKGLEIQYGQAGRFVMEIDSVPTEGVKQVVSTDAVENISILGTGSEGLSRLLSSGINQFFKEFPYKRIGIRCELENDVFTLRGKIFEGGKEYLIRRGLFRGIDVINHNPNNTISFKDMQNRLSAILKR